MKIIMTLLVRDEEDILKQNIDFHLNQGVDFFIATDNCSVDSTKDILREYEKKGLLHYIYEPEDNYNQYVWVTRMARIAAAKYNADWVINNDADEFWWPTNHQNLKKAFSSLSSQENIVSAQRNNFVYMDGFNEEKPFYEQMLHREFKSLNPSGRPLPPKQAHRASSDVVVHQGNHSVAGFEQQTVVCDLVEIFHFPIRSPKQLINKIAKGGAAYERNSELPSSIGITWRNLYNDLKKDGGLSGYLDENVFNKAELKEGVEKKSLLIDDRLCNYLTNIYRKHPRG